MFCFVLFCVSWSMLLPTSVEVDRLSESACFHWNLGSTIYLLCDHSYLIFQHLNFLICAVRSMRYLPHSIVVGVGELRHYDLLWLSSVRGCGLQLGGLCLLPFSAVGQPALPRTHAHLSWKTHRNRQIVAIKFLNCWAKPHFTVILRILLKIPVIGHVIMAANCVEGRQCLLKVVWRLELREQLGSFVSGRLLTQNDEVKKKSLTGMKRGEKSRRAGGVGSFGLWKQIALLSCQGVGVRHTQFRTGPNPILWKKYDKTQGQVQAVFSWYSIWGGIWCSISILKMHTLPSHYPAPSSLQNCRMLTTEGLRWERRGRCCPCRQLNMIHITNCSCLMILGTQLFVDSVVT